MAYIQALLGGVETWVELPKDQWCPEWHKYKRPIVKLRLALYGHPLAGACWETLLRTVKEHWFR